MHSPTDKEVWQLAAHLIERHGVDAVAAAEQRARDALANDDVTGHGIWLSIASAVKELLRRAESGERMN